MTIVANSFAYVIGVATHAKTHTLAVIEAGIGARVDTHVFSTTAAGLSRALAWIKRKTDKDSRYSLLSKESGPMVPSLRGFVRMRACVWWSHFPPLPASVVDRVRVMRSTLNSSPAQSWE